jgi:hypothetical protein
MAFVGLIEYAKIVKKSRQAVYFKLKDGLFPPDKYIYFEKLKHYLIDSEAVWPESGRKRGRKPYTEEQKLEAKNKKLKKEM